MKFKISILFLILGLMVACSESSKQATTSLLSSTDVHLEIPETMVDKSTLFFDRKTSLWSLDNELYSGYAVVHFEDGSLKEKFGILEGRKQNEATTYYPDGHHRLIEHYHKGKLHGEKKSWSPDSSHILVSHLHYHLAKLQGEQKIWYPTGELFKKLNMNKGREEGIQQGFRKNGKLFANYEAKEGRTFGLKKATLCYGLEEENILNN